jgi:mannose-6-phosphate isomerase-like protein (cupin superfamily)
LLVTLELARTDAKRRERKQKSINDLIAPACVDQIIRRAENFFAKRLSANYLTTMLKSSTGGVAMKGYVQNIETIAVKNNDFRQVLYTAKNCQLVIMALKPKEEIGMEVHKLDQFFRVEEGTGEAVLDGVHTVISAGFAVIVPAGTNHNIVNTGSVPLKLYTLYAPPNHRDRVVHHTRAAAEADNEHFDGKTTE